MRISLGALLVLAAAPASATHFINYEAPKVQQSTAQFTTLGVETFDSQKVGQAANFTTDFGTNGKIVATYKGGRIDTANQYGSAGGTGNNIVTFQNLQPIEISFLTTLPEGLTYFGYWLSALDAGNRLEFYKGAQLVAAITPVVVKKAPPAGIGPCPNPYCGNPNPQFKGQNKGEPYTFLNVYFQDENYDRIKIYQSGGGGYESDNHSVGFYTQVGGVPEPATWAMMILGFGLVGRAARRRRQIEVALS